MEPLAPGTEDDIQDTPTPSKKNAEQDRLLSIKAYLPTGEYGNVFELTYNNGSEHWYCKICKCPIMGRVFYHEGGKRHSSNMTNALRRPGVSLVEGDLQPPATDELTTIKIAPGEPVPPGFEGEITKVAQIQERFDSFSSGSLLGLEYLLEIQDYDHEKEPSYLCLLCGKKGDPRTVIAHLVSYNHIQGYLQRHFPKTYQALAPYVTRQFKKNWQDTMNKIAEAIETKYGRLLPHPVDAETFERKKDELYQMVHMGPHFSEKNGVTFEDLVDKNAITKVEPGTLVYQLGDRYAELGSEENKQQEPYTKEIKKRSPSPPVVKKPKKPKPSEGAIRRRSLSSVSSITSSDLDEFDDLRGKDRKPGYRGAFDRDRRRRSRSRSPRRNRYERNSPSPRRLRGRYDNNMPWNRPDYMRSKSKECREVREEKMEEFKRLSMAIESDMQKALKQHKANPEKHPQYNEEWKIFWNRRYKELQSAGKDASKHDFKPEWIVYWNEKIGEIHKADVKVKIDALRKRLGIPSEPIPISFKITKKKFGEVSNKPTPVASQPDQDHEIIIIDDDQPSPLQKRSRSPWEIECLTVDKKVDKKSDERRLSLERVSSTERDPSPPRRRRSRERRSRERGFSRRSGSIERRRSRSVERRRSRSIDRTRYRERNLRSREKSWERDIIYHRELRKDPIMDLYKPPAIIRDVTRHPVDYSSVPNNISPEPEDDGDVNIVAVLRLLTALEDKLGSLGPKVIDMLASALALEKKEANSSETLLDNELNCVLFETVKEKLKGVLHAGLVGYSQEKAFKIAIRKIASLLHLANTRKQQPDPVKVLGVGTVDKAAIAKQIATALILQGKTDVTQAELEQLIDAVVGMAEASKNSSQPITTASFLQKLTSTRPVEPEPPIIINDLTDSPPPGMLASHSAASENTPEPVKDKDSMEGLSDSDLQTLLQNFKDLSSEEQHGLITYLKKMESKEPDRVEKLRKFVNLGEETRKEPERAASPFSKKLLNADFESQKAPVFDDSDEEINTSFEALKKAEEADAPPLMQIDSDDEEYSYEDVFNAANKNVELAKEHRLPQEKKTQEDVLTDAKALIANIMGSIASKSSPAPVRVPDAPPIETPSFNRPNTNINLNLLSQANPYQSFQGNNPNFQPAISNARFPSQNPNFQAANKFQGAPYNPPNLQVNNYQSNMNFQGTKGNVGQPNRPMNPYMTQNVQYPLKNPYGGGYQQNYGSNNMNNMNQNRFPPRPPFNARGGGNNFNSRW